MVMYLNQLNLSVDRPSAGLVAKPSGAGLSPEEALAAAIRRYSDPFRLIGDTSTWPGLARPG